MISAANIARILFKIIFASDHKICFLAEEDPKLITDDPHATELYCIQFLSPYLSLQSGLIRQFSYSSFLNTFVQPSQVFSTEC